MKYPLLTIFGLFLAACKTTVPTATDSSGSTIDSTTATASAEEYRPTYDQPVDLIHTELDVRPEWDKKWLYGTARIRMKPHFDPIDSVFLNARGMEIQQVDLECKGERHDTARFTYDNKVLRIPLPSTARRNDTVTVEIRYISKPDELSPGGSLAITENKGLYFINADGKNPNKPKEFWTQGETEANSAWFPTIESPAQKMTQDLTLTVDTSLVTVSNGLLIESRLNGDGTRSDHWRQSLPAAPYLTMMAAGPFKVVKDTWRGMEVSYYVDPPYEKYARNIFGETAAMIEYFSHLLKTDYPWEKYAQVVVHDYVSGAMENTTAVIHGTNMQQDPREMLDGDYADFISHELFHHWFGDLVTCESWSNITLNEGFANYSEYLWREHRYGRENADRANQSDLNGYLSQAKSIDPPLIRFTYTDAEELYDAISYNKGGRVLHMLRREIGDSAFFESLSRYLKRHAFGSAEVHDLRMAFEETAGRDLNWFFDQWFLKGGHPTLKIGYGWEDSTRIQTVRIEQTQNLKENPLYRLPINIDLYLEDTVLHESVIVNDRKEAFTFLCASKPLLVNVDADKSLLCTKKDEHTREEWRYQYRHAPLYLDRYEAIQGIVKDYKAGSADAAIVQTALADPAPKIRSIALENCGTLVKSDSTAMLQKLAGMAESDAVSDIRKSALKALKKHFPYSSYQGVVEKALKDSSYEVTATAFAVLADKDAPAAAHASSFLMNDSAGAVLAALAEYFEKDTVTNWTVFYGRAILKSKGWDRYSILKSYGKYLKHQPDSVLETAIGQLATYCEFTPQRFARSAAIAELRGINRMLEDRMNGKKTDSPPIDQGRAAVLSSRIKEVLDKYDLQQKSK